MATNKWNSDIIDALQSFSLVPLTTLVPDDFDAFGMRDSHIYRALFIKLLKDGGYNSDIATYIMVFAVAIKNKDRIIEALRTHEKFHNAPWCAAVVKFYNDHTVQYVSAATNKKMPVVNIPTCFPSLAANCWKAITSVKTTQTFLENTWAASINLTNVMQAKQKTWEEDFWKNTVKEGKSGKYNEGFHPEFYRNKENDRYPLLTKNGDIYSAGGPYDDGAIDAWLRL